MKLITLFSLLTVSLLSLSAPAKDLVCATERNLDKPTLKISMQDKEVLNVAFLTDELAGINMEEPKRIPSREVGVVEYYFGSVYTVDLFLAINTNVIPVDVRVYEYDRDEGRAAVVPLFCK